MLPSLPGYGFSGEPAELGWNVGRVAQAWAELMHRLGYTRYVAQGGDVGAAVTDAMGRQAPEGLLGIHMNLLVTVLAGPQPAESEQERAAADQLATFRASGFGYFLEMATRPQTIGYALLDSPVALAAWLLDHDTDSYYKISRAFVDGEPVGNLTRDHILDNITLYWLTGTGASAARSYWEDGQALAQARASGQAPPEVSLPVGFTTFPGEIWRTPRSWVENVLPERHLLQRGRQGRPLRRLGGAGAVLGRDAGGIQVSPLTRCPKEEYDNADPRRPRLRLRGAEPPGGLRRHVHSRYVDAGDVRLHAVDRRRRPAAAARPRLAPDLVRVAMVMPALAQDFEVIAVDQRGIGLSDKPEDGYDTGTLAGDLVALMDALGHERFAVVRHRHRHADRLRPGRRPPGPGRAPDRLAEAPLPGVTPSPPLFLPPPLNARLWHLAFNQLAAEVNERSSRDGRTSSSARSSTPRPGRASCPPTPSSTTSTRSPPTPTPCAAASGSTARSPRPSRRTSSARRRG